jgi:hypothetical protein
VQVGLEQRKVKTKSLNTPEREEEIGVDAVPKQTQVFKYIFGVILRPLYRI